ncbi:hypothetical protein, variant 1 [Capsaspora owczarzaki ATCC 30864]|uniref:Actin-related protein 8 n=2 Tax=Capsaspora owczarzaki (strain ATCC 30864) TaxID=595528 RepID=A0A0D2VWG8_CAPO3|nr:hypothetical protein, variant 1 [Capsaspora owczarzaki ATCC 30864]
MQTQGLPVVVAGANVVVIQPGSLYLRMGVASQPFPSTRLNVLAVRRPDGAAASTTHHHHHAAAAAASEGAEAQNKPAMADAAAPAPIAQPGDANSDQHAPAAEPLADQDAGTDTFQPMKVDDSENEQAKTDPSASETAVLSPREQIFQAMEKHTRRKAMEFKKVEGLFNQCLSFNDGAIPDRISQHDDQHHREFTNVRSAPPFVFGDQALGINPAEPYDVVWPFARGQPCRDTIVTVGSEPDTPDSLPMYRGTLCAGVESIVTCIAAIWRSMLEQDLRIPALQFSNYKAVIIVPDFVDRGMIKLLMRVALEELQFHAVMLQQDSSAATFAAGISSACVIDIGDQKISVSCVEDGIVLGNTRVLLNYGGYEVSEAYGWLLQRLGCAFVGKLDLRQPHNWHQLREWKEAHCHLVPQEDTFPPSYIQTLNCHIRSFGKPTLSYKCRVSDEPIKAPMGVFFPTAFSMAHSPLMRLIENVTEDCEDVFDTTREITQEHDTMLVQVALQATECGEFAQIRSASSPVMSLDEAVLCSIDRCPSDDMRRRMLQSILLVGGGAKTAGLEAMIEARFVGLVFCCDWFLSLIRFPCGATDILSWMTPELPASWQDKTAARNRSC